MGQWILGPQKHKTYQNQTQTPNGYTQTAKTAYRPEINKLAHMCDEMILRHVE